MFITVKAAEGNSHTPSSTDHSISVKSSMLREKNAKGRLVPTAHIHRRKDTHCPGKKHRGGHFQPKQKGGGCDLPKRPEKCRRESVTWPLGAPTGPSLSSLSSATCDFSATRYRACPGGEACGCPALPGAQMGQFGRITKLICPHI